jgi:HK97 family phage portal protein
VCARCECPDQELVEVHPALSVWQNPNGFFTQQKLVESGQQHIDLTGEGWMVIGRVGNVPVELWPVRPDRMQVVTSPTEFILGYIYHGPGGEQVPLDRADVLSMRMPDPEDPFRGLGPVQSIARNLDSARYSAEWNAKFFVNGAIPGGAIKVAKSMTDPEWRRFQSRWRESHQGVGNAHRVAILEGGSEWVDIKFSQKDMQFVEMASLDKATIREAFGMSKFALGDLEDVNRATAEAAKAWFAESITVPRLDRWKGMLNSDFLPQFPGYDPNVSMVYRNPVPADREADREDKKARAEVYQILVASGVHPDDAAKQAGLGAMRTVAREVA